ncbi:MAG: DUF2066 domain-containing protein [Pseudomonadota bacterium]
MVKNPIALLLLVVATIAVPAYSEQPLDLYSSTALVLNQSAELRRQAAISGLSTVLVRLSGRRDIVQSPAVASALKNASSYLYQFSYQSTDQTLTIAGSEKPATRLLMRFSEAPLENLLRESRLPIWPSSRPDVLLWTAANGSGQRYVSTDSDLGRALASASRQRGLPIVNPLLDLQDRTALPLARLWAMDEGSVRVAASRYKTAAVLFGRFSKSRTQWTGSFILLHQGRSEYIRVTGPSQTDVANSLIDRATDYFVGIYAITPGIQSGAASLLVKVDNVNDFSDYAGVNQYLESLPVVQSLTLSEVRPSQVVFRLQLGADIDQFLRRLALDRKLRRMDSDLPSAAPLHSVAASADQQWQTNGVNLSDTPSLEFVWQ